MTAGIPLPRVLPATIVAMVALLGLKTTHLVRAAMPPNAVAATVAAVGKAEAATPQAPAPHAAPPVAEVRAAASPPPSRPAPEDQAISPQERSLLLDLRHRNVELEAREVALNAREAVLAAAEKRLTTRVDEIGVLQQRLEALETNRKARDDANWQGLVKLYEQMKPREAAAIFNDLDKPVLLQVLDRMKEARAAPIMAAMQPERARLVTAELADMRVRDNQVPGPASRQSAALAKPITQPQGTK